MKQHYFLKTLLLFTLFSVLLSCGGDDDNSDLYVPISPVSPVVVDLQNGAFNKLSDYHFFEGEMKAQNPSYKVIPYDLNSTLFTDYAHKKRFVWMPQGSQATYNADGKILEFPVGAVLIKTFYYDNVLPENTTKIIETRLMIKMASGWKFADYIWNDEQTEAYLDLNGSFKEISWVQDGATMSTSYRIPSEFECHTCHKVADQNMPIGPKPQNLNKNFTYTTGSANQLGKWVQEGYLSPNIPQNITSTIDWTDTSKPLELRVRSYLDINCAHCHSEGAHCSYRPMRFAFTETTNPVNLGSCVEPNEPLPSQTYIVARGQHLRSAMYYRMNATDEAVRMPLMGRTVKHTEALQMMKEWINSLDNPCP